MDMGCRPVVDVGVLNPLRLTMDLADDRPEDDGESCMEASLLALASLEASPRKFW